MFLQNHSTQPGDILLFQDESLHPHGVSATSKYKFTTELSREIVWGRSPSSIQLASPLSEDRAQLPLNFTQALPDLCIQCFSTMRIKRSHQLWPLNATVHLYWKCHNKEFYLQDSNIKNLYMECIEEALKYRDQYKNCEIHAFCAMGNHSHQAVSYQGGSGYLSNFMRYAHGLFGARYNRAHRRSGKVAEGRPKTPLIQDTTHQMRVHFYIEANPIRAGFRTLENLKSYIYSSYGFYAYGIKSKFTHLLTPPEWYLELGQTPGQRQQNYRKLFKEYLETYSKKSSVIFKCAFIGDLLWVEEVISKLKKASLAKVRSPEGLRQFILIPKDSS